MLGSNASVNVNPPGRGRPTVILEICVMEPAVARPRITVGEFGLLDDKMFKNVATHSLGILQE